MILSVMSSFNRLNQLDSQLSGTIEEKVSTYYSHINFPITDLRVNLTSTVASCTTM